MDPKKYGVHITHCCVKHGCKYGDKDCPVVLEIVKQEYICESCGWDGIKNVNQLIYKENVEKLKQIFKYYEVYNIENTQELLNKIIFHLGLEQNLED